MIIVYTAIGIFVFISISMCALTCSFKHGHDDVILITNENNNVVHV